MRGLTIAAITLACCAPAAHGQQWSNELTAFFEAQARRDGVSVGALAVTTGDSILYVRAIGGVTDADPVLIGSLSKAVTATAVIRLHRRGLIDLAAPATDYLPDLTANATVRELLNHRSGFERSDGFQTVSETGGVETGPSGSRGDFAYSNVNYALLGRILERATGRPYASVIEDEVFAPLHMNRSSAGPEALGGLTPGRKTWFWWDAAAPYLEPEPSGRCSAGRTRGVRALLEGIDSGRSDHLISLRGSAHSHDRLASAENASG